MGPVGTLKSMEFRPRGPEGGRQVEHLRVRGGARQGDRHPVMREAKRACVKVKLRTFRAHYSDCTARRAAGQSAPALLFLISSIRMEVSTFVCAEHSKCTLVCESQGI